MLKTAPIWAALMRRAFEIDVLECPKCRGRLKFLACITEREVITAILRCLHLPDAAPKIAPARSPLAPECDETLFSVD